MPEKSAYTKIDEIPEITKTLRNSFKQGITKPVDYRIQQLRQLHKMLTDEESREMLVDALVKDGKPRGEGILADVMMAQKECANMINKVSEYAQEEPVSIDLALTVSGDRASIVYEPLGVVLVVATWNYPLQSSLNPLIGVIGAGNCAVVKMSEVCQNTSQVVGKLLNKYLDPKCYRIVLGAVDEVTVLLKCEHKGATWKWDHIMFTGNTQVGKIIAKAAAENLTPVTLELGGKSPCLLDESIFAGTLTQKIGISTSLQMAVGRIAAGKFMNNGQTCVAPDYVLVPENNLQEFLDALTSTLTKFFGPEDEVQSNILNYGRIVSQRHFYRLSDMIAKSKGKVVVGGKKDEKDLFIAPTVIVLDSMDKAMKDSVMGQEIFGPILPIIPYTKFQDAVDFIDNQPEPLAAYLFSNNSPNVNLFKGQVHSGGMCINECVLHLSVDTLPFGGVGKSGLGRLNGHYSFKQFSHQKSVLQRGGLGELGNMLRYPPLTEQKINILKMALIPKPSSGSFWFW